MRTLARGTFVAALLLTACTDRASQPAPPANVIVVLCDTLRADHLGLYGYRRPTSPFLDSLAARALVFDHAYSHYSYTWPTIANLFTGRPYSTLVREGLFTRATGDGAAARGGLSPRNLTLAEELRARGVSTAGVSANPYVTAPLGFGKGFAAFHDVYAWDAKFWEHGLHKYTAEEVNGAALPLVERLQASGGPWMLYLHYFDSHMPYLAPPSDRALFVDAGYRRAGRFVGGYLMRPDGTTPVKYRTPDLAGWLTDEDVAHLRDEYDAEVHHFDRGLQQLFTALEARGALEHTTVVITADHGEAFFERGFWGHGFLSRNEEERVPLIVVPPAGGEAVPARRVDRAVATTTDVYYSLLRHFEKTPGGTRANPWWAVDVFSGEQQRRVAYTEGGHAATVLRNVRYSLYRYDGLEHDALPLPVRDGEYLFDRVSDPAERVDLLAGAAGGEVRRALLAVAGPELQRRLPGPWSDPLLASGGETERQLRALGYQ
jgi:arylsulfatase